jgi:Fe-S oxidoreductase
VGCFEKIMRMNVSNMKKERRKKQSLPPACVLAHVAHSLSSVGRKARNRIRVETKHYSEILVERLDVLKPKFKQPLDKVVAWQIPAILEEPEVKYTSLRESS